MEEKTLLTATLCFLMWNDMICLATKKRKIGMGCLNGYGGGPELSEPLEDAALRELLEESTVKAKRSDLEKVAVCHFKNQKESGETFTCTVHVFFVRNFDGYPVQTSEMGPPQWFARDEVPLSKLMLADQYWFPHVLKGEKVEVFASYGPHQKTLIDKVVIRPLTS